LRYAIVWVVAYVFLLQTTLAAIFFAPVSSPDLDQSVLVLCSGHTTATDRIDGIPSKAHENEDCCKLCGVCGFVFVVGPRPTTVALVDRSRVSVGWSTIENPVSNGITSFGKRARGPPLLT
jgi:hypothetical protein